MFSTLILNANVVNEGKSVECDVLIQGLHIAKIGKDLQSHPADCVVDANGKVLLPGVIDDQVHFREPGLTHKGTIYTESRAAVAGGITSFMEMPNTVPPVLTQERLADKYDLAARSSLCNYSFYMGASHDNLDEVLQTDINSVCGLKIFMGSSTGDMLVDDDRVLERFFLHFPSLIAVHCEDEATIRKNMEHYKTLYGQAPHINVHRYIRSAEACYLSSSHAIELAKKCRSRLHVLHISTARETDLFDTAIPLKDKKITSEVCIHHLWFNDTAYDRLGTFVKWNPAIKTAMDQQVLFEALLADRIDVIATDHAPHTREEKQNDYFEAPSGGPLVQHSLVAMLELYKQGKIALEKIVEKMSHNPAILFQIENRGFIREGYFADLVLADLNAPWKVSKNNILAKCGWSPFLGTSFNSRIISTWVSGHQVYNNGTFDPSKMGYRLSFART